MSFDFTNISSDISNIDIDAVMEKLPFQHKIKKGGEKWWTECINPNHKGSQSFSSLPSMLNTTGRNAGKFFCFSCKNFYSLVEAIKKLTNLETDAEIRTFVGLGSSVDINVQYKNLFLSKPKEATLEDDFFDGNYTTSFKNGLKTEYDTEEFKKRGYTKEFIDHFGIQVCTSIYWEDRYVFPVFSYVEELKDYKCFGWEARRLIKELEPKTLQPKGCKITRVLLNDYALDRNEPLILVEGFPDLARIWSYISKNVSCLWTSKIYNSGVINQLKIINQFKEVIILGDNDEAGRNLEADARNKIDKKVNVYFARISDTLDGRDPSDCSVEELKIVLKNKKIMER